MGFQQLLSTTSPAPVPLLLPPGLHVSAWGLRTNAVAFSMCARCALSSSISSSFRLASSSFSAAMACVVLLEELQV